MRVRRMRTGALFEARAWSPRDDSRTECSPPRLGFAPNCSSGVKKVALVMQNPPKNDHENMLRYPTTSRWGNAFSSVSLFGSPVRVRRQGVRLNFSLAMPRVLESGGSRGRFPERPSGMSRRYSGLARTLSPPPTFRKTGKGEDKQNYSIKRSIWKTCIERPEVGDVPTLSRNGAPSRKGCVINGRKSGN